MVSAAVSSEMRLRQAAVRLFGSGWCEPARSLHRKYSKKKKTTCRLRLFLHPAVQVALGVGVWGSHIVASRGLPAPAVHCPQSHHYCWTGIPVPYSRGYVQSLTGSSERSTYTPASNIPVSHQTASTLGCHTSRKLLLFAGT